MIQDDTGTYVVLQGNWNSWLDYRDGKTIAEIASLYSSDVVPVNAGVKDSSSIGTLQAGDLYYHSGDGTYYYVNSVNQYDDIPNGAWVPLIQ